MSKFITLISKDNFKVNNNTFFNDSSEIFSSNLETRKIKIKTKNLQCLIVGYPDDLEREFVDNEFHTIVIDGNPFIGRKAITAQKISEEILVKGLDKFFPLIDGAFSIFIYDKKISKYYFIRDCLGLKNLYYSRQIHNGINFFVFASTAGSLLSSSIIKSEYDTDSIARYAICNYRTVYRNDNSFFKSIKQLGPSKYIEVNNDQLSIIEYTNLFKNIDYFENKTIEDVAKLFRKQFQNSLEDKFARIENKKVILALSGGIDSGLIAAAANYDIGRKLPSISVTYSDLTNYDETNLINESIEKNISESSFLRIDPEHIIEDLPKLYKRFDTPIPTVSIYIYDLLLREAKIRGYDYILNGGSADALFAGNYPAFMYNLADLYLSDQSSFKLETDKWIDNYGTKDFPKSQKMLIDFFNKSIDINIKGKILPIEIRLGENLLDADFEHSVMDLKSKIYKCSNSYLRSYIINEYFQEILPCVVVTENQSDWFYGTTFSSPYLSKELIKLCWQIPSKMKISNGINKIFPRKSFSNEIPNKILKLVQKVGFNAPFDLWIRGSLKEYVFDTLHSTKFLNRGIYNKRSIIYYLDQHIKNNANNQMLIWQALNLELWMNNWIDN